MTTTSQSTDQVTEQVTFTLDDVREVAGDRAEKMVSAMLDRCIISEVRIGVYRA